MGTENWNVRKDFGLFSVPRGQKIVNEQSLHQPLKEALFQ
jgi:hypothetical protein